MAVFLPVVASEKLIFQILIDASLKGGGQVCLECSKRGVLTASEMLVKCVFTLLCIT